MKLRMFVAAGLAAMMAGAPILAQQGTPTVTLSGIAKKEAKKSEVSRQKSEVRRVQSGPATFPFTGSSTHKFMVRNRAWCPRVCLLALVAALVAPAASAQEARPADPGQDARFRFGPLRFTP